MKLTIKPALKEEMPVIQNMARFYAYDLSKSCGFYELFDWAFPENGLYEALDVSKYWETNCYPFLFRVDSELAGFALISKLNAKPDTWNMGEFFIVGKFQGKGIGKQAAIKIFELFPGQWEITQMPPNIPAIKFWRKVIEEFSSNRFTESTISISEPEPHESNLFKFSSIKEL